MGVAGSSAGGRRGAPASAGPRRRIAKAGPLAGIIALGALLRFATVGVQSIWFDEAISVNETGGSLGHVFSSVAHGDHHPPLYFVALWAWRGLFGSSPAVMRSLSALLGTATIAVVYLVARHLASRRVALVAAALAALHPLLFNYSQELRPYPLFLLTGGLSVLTFLQAREARTPARLSLWALASAIALLSHYFSVFVVAAEALWLLRQARGSPRSTVLAVGAVGLVGAALLPLVRLQSSGAFIANLRGSSLIQRLEITLKQLLVGPGGPLPRLTPLLALPLVALAMVLLVRRGSDGERRSALLMAALAGAGVLVPLLLAGIGFDFYDARNVMLAWIPCAVIVAIGLAGQRAGWLGLTGLLALCGLSLGIVAATELDKRYQRDDWRDAATALGVASASRVIVANDDSAALALYRPTATGVKADTLVTVGELDIVLIGAKQPGSPIQPPSLAALGRPPTGFSLVARRRGQTFGVLVYRSQRPLPVDPARLGNGLLGRSALLEPAGAAPGAPH